MAKSGTKKLTARPPAPHGLLFDPEQSYSRIEVANKLKVHPKSVGRWDTKRLIKRRIVINDRIVRYSGADLNRDLCGIGPYEAA